MGGYIVPYYALFTLVAKGSVVARTTVSDFVIWTKHIHGDPGVAGRIIDLQAGETIRLRVEGVDGAWCKMANGRDGRPTPGIRPIGRTQRHWKTIYAERRGQLVDVEIVEENAAGSKICQPPLRSGSERLAAIQSYFALGDRTWRSDRPYGPREELHDR